MRIITTFAFALLFAAMAAVSLSSTTASAAPTAERKASCEQQKKACMDAGARTGSFGERFVPPDVVKRCYAQYRECMKH